eukprot:890704-Pelagomonas_calceolata.AAC.2
MGNRSGEPSVTNETAECLCPPVHAAMYPLLRAGAACWLLGLKLALLASSAACHHGSEGLNRCRILKPQEAHRVQSRACNAMFPPPCPIAVPAHTHIPAGAVSTGSVCTYARISWCCVN